MSLAAAQSENAGLERRLADRAAEVTTLDRQLTQARAQFEHYQETTAAQHAEERRSYEQRLAKLDHDLAGTNRLLTLEQSARSQQDARMTQLTSDHKAQQEALRTAVDELNDVRSAREHLAERLAEATSARQSLTEQLAASQQHLTEAKIAQASLEQRVGMLVEQVARAEARTESLAEEKIALLQGQARLEQQIRHANLHAGAQ